jgi:hypothetical protein
MHTLICADDSHSGACPYAWFSGQGHVQEAVDRMEAACGDDYDPAGLPVEATLAFYATAQEAEALVERARAALRIDPAGVCGLTGAPVTLELRDLTARDPEWRSTYDHLIEQHEIEHGTTTPADH